MPYHTQMNGLVDRSHQTIMQMIRKLGDDKKVDWLGHLAEIVHAYNATQSECDGVQPTLSDVWVQAKVPSQLLLPHLKEHRGPKVRCLYQSCG